MKLLEKYQDEIYSFLRFVIGFLFLWHGIQKLLGFPPSQYATPLFIKYVAGAIELIGGILISVGFMTRWAAFLSSGLMAFAYWMAHGTKAFLPIQNGGELAVIYCFVLLFISAKGSGKISIDTFMKK